MTFYKRTPILILLTLIVTFSAQAQGECSALVEQAIALSEEVCSDTQRNQACYGNNQIVVEVTTDDFEFDSVGDHIDLSTVQSMTLSDLNEANDEWGVSLLQIQANLPATLPGQNVTFVLFGDVSIEEASTSEDLQDETVSPMQSFYLATGIGENRCAEAPESGILIQTPEGDRRVNLMMNGVEVEMGSTLYARAQAGGVMTIYALEGEVIVQSFGIGRTLEAGTQVEIMLDDDLIASNAPNAVQPYNLDDLVGLPLSLLETGVELVPALSEADLENLVEQDLEALGGNDAVVIGSMPVIDWSAVYPLEPYCNGEIDVPPEANRFIVNASYGFNPGNPAEHEIGLSASDLMSQVNLDISITNATLSPLGERVLVAAEGLLHIGDFYEVGELSAGEYTVSLTTSLNDFSIAYSCTYTVP